MKKFTRIRFLLITVFPLLILSGIIDFMVIKNDYAFHIPTKISNSTMKFINEKTQSDEIFLSYRDMIDPITFSGRKHFYGFFRMDGYFSFARNPYWPQTVKNIYEASTSAMLLQTVQKTGITYILIPKIPHGEFDFKVKPQIFRDTFPVVFEDSESLIVSLKKNYEFQ